MPRKTKQAPLPPVTPERLAIFDQYEVTPEVRESLHRQLCTATPEQRQMWAETHGVPVREDDLHAWENQILATSQANIRRFIAVLDRTLGQIHSGLEYCKQRIVWHRDHDEVKHLLGV